MKGERKNRFFSPAIYLVKKRIRVLRSSWTWWIYNFRSTWRVTRHASFVFLIFFFHFDRGISAGRVITCTIVWKRQEIIIAIRNGPTKGETLCAFRNGSANYSWVLVYLPFFPPSLSFSLHVFLSFPFRKLSLSLFISLSRSLSLESWLALLTRSVRTCAGNWKFRAYPPLARFSLARFTCSPPRI